MTQKELYRAVADATGESMTRIARHGFQLVDPAEACFDPDQDREPLVLDWDTHFETRYVRPL